jgi:hypothetical protein
MPLDLLVPDLLMPADAPAALRELRLPNVEKWLARADVERVPQRNATECLARLFALPDPVAVAAITLAADDRPRPGEWLRADPVYARVERDTMTLHDAAILEVTREEANALLAALQALYRDDALEFAAPTPDRWYVRVPEGEMPATTPLDDALGRDIFRRLPQGTGRIKWPAAITEAQMLFASHEVNARREAAGKLPINSVWFWGGGALPATVTSPYALLYGDDALLRGLGKLSNTRVAALPADFTHIDAVRESESVLVLHDALTRALRRGDEAAWKAAAEQLDATWLTTIANALDRFGAVRILLPAARGACIATVTPAARWRWFRGRRPLASHA